MKAKKWLTIITFSVTIVAMLVALCAHYKDSELAYDFSMAIFGSALLGFVMSIIEYFAERRKAMEEFLSASLKAYLKFRKLKYVDIEGSQEMILSCIEEEQHNISCDDFECETSRTIGLAVNHKHRDEYIAWLQANEVMPFSEKDGIQVNLVEAYNHHIKKYQKLFLSRISMYLQVSNIDLQDLSNAYGNLDFLFGNKNIRQTAFNSIYQQLQGWRRKLLSESYHFKLLEEGEGNFAMCVRKLFELNDMFFQVQKQETSNTIQTVVYQHLFDNMLDRIEEFRCATYFEKHIIYETKIPVLSKVKIKNLFEKSTT